MSLVGRVNGCHRSIERTFAAYRNNVPESCEGAVQDISVELEKSLSCSPMHSNCRMISNHQLMDYAIDTTTHNTVWIYPDAAKQLAISANGILYLRGPKAIGESLVAINLQ